MDATAASPTLALIDWIIRGGLVAMLLLVLFGGYYGVWFYGPMVRTRNQEYEARIAQLEKSESEWKIMALDLLRATRAMVEIHENTQLRK
jgi:hypothetical protein